MTDLRIKDKLYAPLKVDSRQGRGGTYGYVKWQHVADRMNETFGMNWSSHVEHEDKIDNTIIVRVTVCAKDPISGEQYCQEGYGASIMRGTDEPGSAHKGAYSKALKDACKKWGIGLHLEEGAPANTNSAPTNMPPGFTGHETAQPAPTPAPVEQTFTPSAPSTAPTPAAPMAPNTPVAPVSTPVPEAPTAPAMAAPTMPAPMAEAPETPAPTGDMGLPPTPPPNGVNQAAPAPAPTPSVSPQMVPPTPAPTNNGSVPPETPGSITDVQEMAIQNLSRVGGEEERTIPELLKSLLDDPKCELNRPVTSLKELSYNEAVCVIKASKSL